MIIYYATSLTMLQPSLVERAARLLFETLGGCNFALHLQHHWDAWERSIYGACVQKLGIYPHGAIHSAGMYSYSSWYWSRGSAVRVPFLVVTVHLVHPYLSGLRGFTLMFDAGGTRRVACTDGEDQCRKSQLNHGKTTLRCLRQSAGSMT